MRRVGVGLSALLTGSRSYPPRASTALLITADENRTSLEFHFFPSRLHLVSRGSDANPDTRRIYLAFNSSRSFIQIWSITIEILLGYSATSVQGCNRFLSLAVAFFVCGHGDICSNFHAAVKKMNIWPKPYCSLLHWPLTRSQRTVNKLEAYIER